MCRSILEMVGTATTLNPIVLAVLKCGPKIGLAGTSKILLQILIF